MQAKDLETYKERIEKEVQDFNEAKAKYDADLQARLGRISMLQELVAEGDSKEKEAPEKKKPAPRKKSTRKKS